MGLSSKNNHLLPADKLLKIAKKRIDNETISGIQKFAEKIIQDIITRSTLLAKHAGTDIIDTAEICNVIEKNFDNTFGIKGIIPESNLPLDTHIEKMAQISKQNK